MRLVSRIWGETERVERWRCPQCGKVEKIILLRRAHAVTRVPRRES